MSQTNQQKELLYELQIRRTGVTSREAMIEIGIGDLPKVVSVIRERHPDLIIPKPITVVNRRGRKVGAKRYFLNEAYREPYMARKEFEKIVEAL